MNSLLSNLFHNDKTTAPQKGGGNNLADSSIDPLLHQDMTVLSNLTPESNKVIANSYEEARRSKQAFIEPTHLLLGLLANREIFDLLKSFSVDLSKLVRELRQQISSGVFTGEPTFSEEVKQVLEESFSISKNRGVEFISPHDILLGLFSRSVNLASLLEAQGINKSQIETKLATDSKFVTGKQSVLKKYGVDLIEEAKAGKIDPVSGRETEIDRVLHILLRRTKNNPILIGEAGVGKTAVVEGLVLMMAKNEVPPQLLNKKIIKLDVSSLVAGASHRGDFEERLQNVIKETMLSSGQVILFVDEIHTLIGAGESNGSTDASNILKPYLSRGQLQLIGTTTTTEYRRYFEKDRAFSRRFQPVLVEEPSEEVALNMLKTLQSKYEQYHQVNFSPASLEAAVHLSKRYVGERFLPDKAIDLIDEAGAQVKIAKAAGKRPDTTVGPGDIEEIVSKWTGIPITRLTEKEGEKLLHLEQFIHQKLIGQDIAVKAVAEAVRRGRIGLANANRPIASFIFLGPTGTGKTELAKTLAEILFGRSDAMIRLDMSEYMEKHEVAKLVGAPPGYVGYEEGGQLTEAVRLKPYSIVLLDEIEKAHPDVFNILLQLLEDGRLTDNKGNTVSFKNTIIIATSNIASSLIQQKLQSQYPTTPQDLHNITPLPTQVSNTPEPRSSSVQFDQKAHATNPLRALVMPELSKVFKPELLNRFDEIVVFEPLSQTQMLQIARLGVANTRKMLLEQKIELQISQNVLIQLAKDGYDPVYGARPLRRLIQTEIENPIAVSLINKYVGQGDILTVDYDPTHDQFLFNKAAGIHSLEPVASLSSSLQR